jgi:hypothetical protein
VKVDSGITIIWVFISHNDFYPISFIKIISRHGLSLYKVN